MKTLRIRLSLFTVVFALLGLGCGSSDAAPSAEAPAAAAVPVRELDVAAAAALFDAGSAHAVDVNDQFIRDQAGTVPGAVLLTSSNEYALSELPGEGLLVFYCGSTQCTASDTAATRAREAGREVAVMRPGISGWVAAGKPVANRVGAEAPAAGEGVAPGVPAAPAAPGEAAAADDVTAG